MSRSRERHQIIVENNQQNASRLSVRKDVRIKLVILKTLYVTFIFLICACSNLSKSPAKSEAAAVTGVNKPVVEFLPGHFKNPAQVDQIQKNVNVLNSLDFSDSLVLEDEDFLGHTTDGGATLTGHFSGPDPVKITEWVGLSYGVHQHSFFFAKDRLVFILEKEDYFFSDSAGTDPTHFSEEFRADYYFTGEKLIDSANKGKKRFNDESSVASSLLSKAATYQQLLRKKKN